jgi:hypothetical protein
MTLPGVLEQRRGEHTSTSSTCEDVGFEDGIHTNSRDARITCILHRKLFEFRSLPRLPSRLNPARSNVTHKNPRSGRKTPLDGGNFAIYAIHQVDKRDKHPLLTPVIRYSSADGIQIENDSGQTESGFTMGTTQPFPHYLDFPRGWRIKNHGRPTTTVMFEYGAFGSQLRPVETLRIYSRMIVQVVEVLEGFCDRF